ncbi:2196_t:CDS:2, partial [Ambispora leptoticha]
WLHNEQYFAVAQKKYVYIYDQNGLEVHRLKRHIEPNRLEFLPYHFLLVSVGNAGWLKYQDTSTGKFVVELRTKLGKCDAMTQNPWNAIIHLGHANGTVTLWSPNMTTPLVKMLTHKGPVTALAIDRTGKYMATSGLDGQLKLWDIRTYKSLQEYFTTTPACSLSISQMGLLAVGWGPHISVWKDAFLQKQKSPYMTHIQRGTQLQDLHFCPYEDVLGFGHSQGISSLIIPEPNFDSLEANPFQTKKQRQEAEVRSLLEKIQPEMITLDPSFIGKMDRTPQELREKERMEREAEQTTGDMSKPRKKTRGKNSSLKRYLRKKNKNVIDEKRLQIEEKIARERQEREKRKRGELDHDKPFTALDRFGSDY